MSRLPLLVVLASLFAACAGIPPAAHVRASAPAAISIVHAQFGVFGANDEGHRILFETDRFPAIVAAPYGWFVVFKTAKPTVIWREEFELPIAPPTWGPGEAMGVFTVSPDRKTAVTERIVPTRMGFATNEWRYAPGDPTGAHVMRVYIDGQLVGDFRFAIEPLSATRPTSAPRDGTI